MTRQKEADLATRVYKFGGSSVGNAEAFRMVAKWGQKVGGNNVFVGKDGDVYRRGSSGWSKQDNKGDWSQVQKAKSGNQTGLSQRQKDAARDRASQMAGGPSPRVKDADRERTAQAAGSRSGSQTPGPSAGQRTAVRDRASQTTRPSWDSGSSQSDVLRQLDRESKARSAGAQRSRDFKSSRKGSASGRNRTQGGQSRGGRKGRGG